MIIEIKCKRWILPRETWGITLYPFIFYHDKFFSESLRRHEWVHIEQVRRLGWLKFYARILFEYVKYGYSKSPLEIDAYAHQNDSEQPWLNEKYLYVFEVKGKK